MQPPDVNPTQPPAIDQDAVERYNATLDQGGDYDAANNGTDPITRAMREETDALYRLKDMLNRKSNKDKDEPEEREI